MERITLDKNNNLKSWILDGLKVQEFSLVKKTRSIHPFYLYFNDKLRTAVVRQCKTATDEFIILDTTKPAKVRVAINDLQRNTAPDAEEIAELLTEIIEQKTRIMPNVVFISRI